MTDITIASVEQFLSQLKRLDHDKAGLLYRGQAEAEWPVSCSAARRLKQDPANPIEDQLIESLLVGYLEFLIAKARMRGFLPSGFNENSSDLDLLAQLQHQGAATGLIDFTRQPSVALWFACNESRARDGTVYILARSKTEEISNRRDLENKTIQSFYEGDKLWSWEPPPRGNRMVAQSSIFVLGAPAVALDKMGKITVRAESKNNILAQLESMYGISEEMLFSDFPGFAVSNGSNKNFDVRRTISYWQEQIRLAVDDGDDSKRATAHFNCGVAYSAMKNSSRAIEQYDEAICVNPEFAEAYINRGLARVALKQYQEVLDDYDRAIELNPKLAEAYSNRALAKTTLGRYKEALVDCDKAIELNPEFAEAYSNRGLAKTTLGRYKEALVDCEKAIELNPELAEAYSNRGLAKAALGRNEEAIVDCDKAIDINPTNAEAYSNRGNAKTALGRYEEALADYDKAIDINPTNAEVYNNRGSARTDLGQYEEALADYDKAIRTNPRYANAYSNRGAAKAELREYEEAIVDYDKAIRINPKRAEFYYNRGLAKRALGEEKGAQNDFAKANEIVSRFRPPDP